MAAGIINSLIAIKLVVTRTYTTAHMNIVISDAQTHITFVKLSLLLNYKTVQCCRDV